MALNSDSKQVFQQIKSAIFLGDQFDRIAFDVKIHMSRNLTTPQSIFASTSCLNALIDYFDRESYFL